MLKMFFSSPKKIISKEEFIVKVWGYDSNATDNNVEAYISFLRKKLAFIGALCNITSIKKIGYKIEEISEILHTKPSTVKSQLLRARQKLKTYLEGVEFDD